MIPYILVGLGFISLCFFLFKRDKKGSIIAIGLKALTSMFFIATAIFSLIENITSRDTLTYYSILPLFLLLLGLIFGMVGDILLDFKIYFKTLNMRYLALENDHDILMITGMGAFGIGHISYIIGSLLLDNSLWLKLIISFIIGALAIFLIMLISIKIMKMTFRKFLIPVIIYGFLLSSFIAFSLFRIVNHYDKASLLILIGSVLFIVSDLILSITYFSKEEDYKKEGFLNPESRFMIVSNHITYYAAQFLIALAILFI